MKGYIDYMDNISVSPELHDKIMQKVYRQQKPINQNRVILRYAGMAACFLVLLLCVWSIPNLFDSPTSDDPGMNGGQLGVIDIDPTPGITSRISNALTLNRIDSQMSASRIFVDGHFWHELTNEQTRALLPDLRFPISATAHYFGNGTLFDVVVAELTSSGGAAMVDELYLRTVIRFAPGAIVSCAIYNYEPVESEIYDVPVVAGMLDVGILNDGITLYVATFIIGEIAYSIELYDNETGESGLNRLTEIVSAIIRNGSMDLSILDNPVIPELRDEQVSLSEARSDPDFGEYLPISVPVPFRFDNARRFINQETNSLMTFWGADRAESIRWFVSMPTEHDIAHIVSVHEHEKYDLSLYSIPWAFSVPDEFHYYFQSPVFLAEELTIDVIRARTVWESSRSGATPGWQTSQFSVLYDNVLLTVSMNGVSPEQIWNMITANDSAQNKNDSK